MPHFVSVLSSATNTAMAEELGAETDIDPATADGLIGTCRLLDAISGADDTESVAGPLRRDRQQWIGIGRRSAGPDRSRFIAARDMPDGRPSTKPFGVGLFTSTATRTGDSMWRTFLDGYVGSDLFPLPWHVWRLTVADSAAVLEIAGARDWAEFVGEYSLPDVDPLCPDWHRVAADFDGVHLTVSAVAAVQGFTFPVPRRGKVTAPTYWDVESTLWLNWAFTGAERTETVTEGL